jgi:hypothetical protein
MIGCPTGTILANREDLIGGKWLAKNFGQRRNKKRLTHRK